MNINPIQQTPNFKGYKNLICNIHNNSNVGSFEYFSMQLNNDGVNDLSDWKTIQKDLYGIPNPSDVITFQILDTPLSSDIFFADNPLDMDFFKNVPRHEKLALKAHSLIASLTRRISEASLTTQDSQMPNVLNKTVRNLKSALRFSSVDIEKLIYSSFYKTVPEQKIANIANQMIQKKMLAYFK